ncbi:MAG: alpha/beta fold hydrolase [Gammaproteobacteria bacterium]|nr:alpha/beta fold hydrolase [Gammaproteobacteria bacterium]
MRLAFNQFESSGESESSKGSHAGKSSKDKQTILILHGLFGSKRNWQSIARQLSEQCKVFTLDLRNHGESEHSETMSYQDMADDVFQFISEHDLEEVSIVGHSMGGKVAMQMALGHPEIIKRLIIIDIAPVQYQHSFDNLISSLDALPLDQISSRQEADEYLKTSVQPESLRQFLLQNLHKLETGFCWRINLKAIQSCIDELMGFHTAHREKQYQKSVLFLKGEKSDYIKHLYERQIFSFFPRALFITLEGAGHWLHTENPDFVVNEIGKFIK